MTATVLAELERAADPRFREIMSATLTGAEYQQACAVIAHAC